MNEDIVVGFILAGVTILGIVIVLVSVITAYTALANTLCGG